MVVSVLMVILLSFIDILMLLVVQKMGVVSEKSTKSREILVNMVFIDLTRAYV